MALVLADALVERFGGDSIADLIARALSAASRCRPRRFQPTMIRPILRYGERPLHAPAADVTAFDADLQRLDRRHDRDDVRGARHRAGGHAGRRRRCASSSSTCRSGATRRA